jgi:glycosyltransferase involved in cell wall biosynthesis
MKLPFVLKSAGVPKGGSAENIKKIIHLAPRDGIGGVETAVRSMEKLKHDGINFKVNYIVQVIASARLWQRWAAFISPLPLLLAVRKVTSGHTDLLIVSLWRSAIVGIFAKCLRPKLKLVVFIHNATDVHWLDFIVTRLAMSLALEVWADSKASLRERFPHLAPERCRVISFVTRHFEALPARKVSPDFIFWGRINAQKGLDHALRIFAAVLKDQPGARFWIIGPDEGLLQTTQQLSKSLNLTDNVFFLGPATLAEIADHALKASFYLQTSLYEGMAMSVVEAMQMGLVPIVTPVGEIPSYCSHSFNALIVKSDRQVVENVRDLLSSNKKYEELRLNSIATWEDAPLYAESILQACEELLADHSATA